MLDLDCDPASGDSRFLRYETLCQVLKKIAADYPALVTYGTSGRSLEGREIPLLTVTDSASGPPESKPAIWIDGNLHAVELSASTACLYFVRWLVAEWSRDSSVRRALLETTFYVCPRANPDGAEAALLPSPRLLCSGTRHWPTGADSAPGLYIEDVDGDGRILQMRIQDPLGAWKTHPDDNRLMVLREPEDRDGPFYILMAEGRIKDHDGHSIRLANRTGDSHGVNFNRNFPGNWRPETDQPGAGSHPASEPEVRAIVEFVEAHANICIAVSFHTMSGVLLRPFADKDDSTMLAGDLRLYKHIGRKGSELTGYPALSIFHDFLYAPGRVESGTFDWIYRHKGVLGWTVEIWNPHAEAGIEQANWLHWYRDHPVADELRFIEWSDRVLGGALYQPWTPFDHPELGRVEIGGWDWMAGLINPPRQFLSREVARFPRWIIWQSAILPRLVVREAFARALDDAGSIWNVVIVIQNDGWLATNVTEMALAMKQTLGLTAELEVPVGASVESNTARQELGELVGRSSRLPSLSFPSDTEPTGGQATAWWIVSAAENSIIRYRAWHARAGSVTGTIQLRADGTTPTAVR